MFEWTYDQVKHKLDYIQYYKGPNSHIVKRYQANNGKKPGGSKTQITGQVTGHRSGQVTRKNIFLPRKLTIFLGYTKIWFYQES